MRTFKIKNYYITHIFKTSCEQCKVMKKKK